MKRQDLEYLVLRRLHGVIGASRRMGVTIGEGCRILSKVVTTDPWLVSIGDRVTISTKVTLVTHDGSGWLLRDGRGRRYRYAPIRVGSDVFIGAASVVLPGVSIGDRCIIGAGSVVTRSVPSGSIAAGNPAKVIGRYDDMIDRMRSWPSDGDMVGATYRERVDSIAEPGFRPDLTAGQEIERS